MVTQMRTCTPRFAPVLLAGVVATIGCSPSGRQVEVPAPSQVARPLVAAKPGPEPSAPARRVSQVIPRSSDAPPPPEPVEDVIARQRVEAEKLIAAERARMQHEAAERAKA